MHKGKKEGDMRRKKDVLRGGRMLGKDSTTVNKYSHSVQSSNNVKIYTQLMQKHTI